MTEPTVAARAPIAVDVEAGRTYYWCSCGLSATGRVYFCACKHSASAPLCDGTHKTLP